MGTMIICVAVVLIGVILMIDDWLNGGSDE